MRLLLAHNKPFMHIKVKYQVLLIDHHKSFYPVFLFSFSFFFRFARTPHCVAYRGSWLLASGMFCSLVRDHVIAVGNEFGTCARLFRSDRPWPAHGECEEKLCEFNCLFSLGTEIVVQTVLKISCIEIMWMPNVNAVIVNELEWLVSSREHATVAGTEC